jgi:hypothetical protein
MENEMKRTNTTTQPQTTPVSLGQLLKSKPIETEQLYQWIKTGIQNKQNGEMK